MATIVVTRHPALVQLLVERGIVPADVEVLTHVSSPEQIRGYHVIGVLPLHLAAVAAQVTEVPIAFPDASLRGVELTIEQLREMAGAARSYVVRTAETEG
jgi:collagenase-like PrtC family protease